MANYIDPALSGADQESPISENLKRYYQDALNLDAPPEFKARWFEMLHSFNDAVDSLRAGDNETARTKYTEMLAHSRWLNIGSRREPLMDKFDFNASANLFLRLVQDPSNPWKAEIKQLATLYKEMPKLNAAALYDGTENDQKFGFEAMGARAAITEKTIYVPPSLQETPAVDTNWIDPSMKALANILGNKSGNAAQPNAQQSALRSLRQLSATLASGRVDDNIQRSLLKEYRQALDDHMTAVITASARRGDSSFTRHTYARVKNYLDAAMPAVEPTTATTLLSRLFAPVARAGNSLTSVWSQVATQSLTENIVMRGVRNFVNAFTPR